MQFIYSLITVILTGTWMSCKNSSAESISSGHDAMDAGVWVFIIWQCIVSEVATLVIVVADAQLLHFGEVDVQRTASVVEILTVERLWHK